MKRMEIGEYDYTIKIIMVGESGVGKSSIFGRYCEKYYSDASTSTIGVDYNIKGIKINGKNVKLQIWDTAGQERYRTITTSYYRGAHIIMLVFDLTNEYSFARIKYWLSEMKKYIEHDNFILIGNKSDRTENYQVGKKEINDFILENNIEYLEVSAKKNINVKQAFEKLVPKLVDTYENTNSTAPKSKILHEYELNPTDNCC